jgi:hypothetical protein
MRDQHMLADAFIIGVNRAEAPLQKAPVDRRRELRQRCQSFMV